jgi:hypothetical protein
MTEPTLKYCHDTYSANQICQATGPWPAEYNTQIFFMQALNLSIEYIFLKTNSSGIGDEKYTNFKNTTSATVWTMKNVMGAHWTIGEFGDLGNRVITVDTKTGNQGISLEPYKEGETRQLWILENAYGIGYIQSVYNSRYLGGSGGPKSTNPKLPVTPQYTIPQFADLECTAKLAFKSGSDFTMLQCQQTYPISSLCESNATYIDNIKVNLFTSWRRANVVSNWLNYGSLNANDSGSVYTFVQNDSPFFGESAEWLIRRATVDDSAEPEYYLISATQGKYLSTTPSATDDNAMVKEYSVATDTDFRFHFSVTYPNGFTIKPITATDGTELWTPNSAEGVDNTKMNNNAGNQFNGWFVNPILATSPVCQNQITQPPIKDCTNNPLICLSGTLCDLEQNVCLPDETPCSKIEKTCTITTGKDSCCFALKCWEGVCVDEECLEDSETCTSDAQCCGKWSCRNGVCKAGGMQTWVIVIIVVVAVIAVLLLISALKGKSGSKKS